MADRLDRKIGALGARWRTVVGNRFPRWTGRYPGKKLWRRGGQHQRRRGHGIQPPRSGGVGHSDQKRPIDRLQNQILNGQSRIVYLFAQGRFLRTQTPAQNQPSAGYYPVPRPARRRHSRKVEHRSVVHRSYANTGRLSLNFTSF